MCSMNLASPRHKREVRGRRRSLLHAIRSWAWSIVALRKLKSDGVEFSDCAPRDRAGERVLLGPVNSAGQGYLWARALERARPELLPLNLKVSSPSDRYGYPADLRVSSGYAAHSRKWQKSQLIALEGYRAVLVESASLVLGGAFGADCSEQIEALRRKDVKVGLIFHGSDLRDPDVHLTSEPDSYFGVDESFTDLMRRKSQKSKELIARTGLPVFVSTPDLLREVDNARLLPVVVNPEAWATKEPPLTKNRRPRVVHAPSSSHIKGTDLIDGTMQRLNDSGVIDYRRISGLSHSEMRDVYRESDIVLDQFRGGPYGVAACEALAAGRIVVSHVPSWVRELTRELAGRELPIIQSSADELERTIIEILDRPEVAIEKAAQGPVFVTHWHNGRESGQVLSEWLDSAP